MKQRDWFFILIGIISIQFIFIAQPLFIEKEPAEQIPQYYKIHTEEHKSWPEKVIDDPVAFFTMVLAVFTMGLAGVTVALWKEAKRASAEQAALSKRSADAAETAIEASNLSNERQLRAYIHPGNAKITTLAIGSRPAAQVTFKNFGHTPGFECRIWIGIVMLGNSQVDGYDWPPPENSVRIVESIIPPTETTTMTLNFLLDVEYEWIEQIQTGEWGLYVYGVVSYRDVFGKSRRTRLRYVIGAGHGMPADGRTMFVSDRGNDAT